MLKCKKQKDAPEFAPIPLERKQIDLGNGLTSCVLRPAIAQAASKRDLAPNHSKALKALAAFGPGGAKNGHWLKGSGLGRSTFNRIRKSLVEHDLVTDAAGNGFYTLTPKGDLALNPMPNLPIAARIIQANTLNGQHPMDSMTTDASPIGEIPSPLLLQ